MKAISGFIQKFCSKTSITSRAYNKYAEITNIFNKSRRAGRIFAHQSKVRSIFTGVNAVRQEVGYFPVITAAAGFVLLPVGGTTTGLFTGLALKKGALSLAKFII